MEEKKVKKFNFRKISSKDLEKHVVDGEESPNVYKGKTKKKKEKKIEKQNKKSSKSEVNIIRNKSVKIHQSEDEKEAILNKIFGTKEPEPVICYTCGQQIKHQPLTYYKNNKEFNICDKCFRMFPKCKNCGFPIKNAIKGIPKKYCDFCKPSGYCEICETKINARSTKHIEYVSGIFCESCVSNLKRCWNCETPLKEPFKTLEDGRIFCESCFPRTIKDLQSAQTLFQNLISKINRISGVSPKIDFEFQIVDFDELNKSINNRIFAKHIDEKKIQITRYSCEEKLIQFFSDVYGEFLFDELNPKLSNYIKTKRGFAFWLSAHSCLQSSFTREFMEIKNLKGELQKLFAYFYNIATLTGPQKVFEKIKNNEIKIFD